MLARLRVLLPVRIHTRRSDSFQPKVLHHPLYRWIRINGFYGVDPKPPLSIGLEPSEVIAEGFRWAEGEPALVANAVELTFSRESFERAAGMTDPTVEIGLKLVERLVALTRYMTRAHWLHLRGAILPWNLRYLADDGGELEKTEGFVRGRGAAQMSIPASVWITAPRWQQIAERLDADSPEPSEPDTLLLDAFELLPHDGPAVVLAFTAVEVAANQTLARLADVHRVSPRAWEWIHARRHDQRPTIEERLGTLMQAVAGRSLEVDAPALWGRFQRLRKARNAYVHEASAPATPADTAELLHAARDVLDWLDRGLPEAMRRPPLLA